MRAQDALSLASLAATASTASSVGKTQIYWPP